MARAHRSNRLIDRTAEPSPNLVADRISAVGSLCIADQVPPSFRVRCALYRVTGKAPDLVATTSPPPNAAGIWFETSVESFGVSEAG